MEALSARTALACQSAPPERSGSAPARAYVVLHEETVLHHVGIGPYLLVRIARHVAVGEEKVGVVNLVAACGPRRTVAGGASHLGEESLAGLEIVGSGVAGGRDGEASVPDHEVLVLFCGHLGVETLARQVCLDVAFEIARMPFGVFPVGVDAVDVFGETGLHLGVFRRFLGIVCSCEVEIVVSAVGAVDVGDVPDGIGSGSVKHRSAAKGVGVASHILGAVAL